MSALLNGLLTTSAGCRPNARALQCGCLDVPFSVLTGNTVALLQVPLL
jgi:hypothetical protein